MNTRPGTTNPSASDARRKRAKRRGGPYVVSNEGVMLCVAAVAGCLIVAWVVGYAAGGVMFFGSIVGWW